MEIRNGPEITVYANNIEALNRTSIYSMTKSFFLPALTESAIQKQIAIKSNLFIIKSI